MINRIYLKNPKLKELYRLEWEKLLNQHSIKLRSVTNSVIDGRISFFIEFSSSISAFRDSTYKWKKFTKREAYINSNNSKIIVLNDGTHFLSTKNIGAWIIKNSRTIEWVLKSTELTPLFKYDSNGKRIFNNSFSSDDYDLGILFTKSKVPEFSRSKLPFKPIICFTDHCDFDSNVKLEKQLAFFEEYKVKTSKGFFLNHFSKREDNSSYEREPELISSFQKNGHEVFYHSLTQSLRNANDAIREFKNFKSPSELIIKTYVDHGYQIYNFTKKQDSGINDSEWSEIVTRNGIENFWNYLDSGTAMHGICNQLNPKHFTLSHLIKHNGLSLKKIIRTELFFRGNENSLLEYRELAKLVKDLKNNISVKSLIRLLKSILKISPQLAYSLLFRRNKTFKYAQFTPWIFQSKIGSNTYNFFQTIEVTNFEETFSRQNINSLKSESGILVAHCYFASPLTHQEGKLFDGDEISTKNHQNFEFLKGEIVKGNIWNPSISELIDYVNQLSKLEFSWDSKNEEIISNLTETPLNYIKYD